LKNRSENLTGRSQISSILKGNSSSIARESGGIWIVQADLQPISFRSDRLLGPLFAWAWPRLEARGMNPSIPRKFALALILVAVGFAILVWTIGNLQGADGKLPWEMLGLAYLINTMGELCLSPIGLSMVTKLAAPKDVGMAMGAWFMCTAIGNSTAGHIAAVAVSGTGTVGLEQYASTYTLIAYAGFGLGALFLFGAPLINKLMHGVK